MTGKKTDFFWAFVIGGLLSIGAEVLWIVLLFIGLPADSWAITVYLMALGLIGMITSYFGWFQKLVARGGFGAFLPFCSLPCSIMLDYAEARSKGEKIGKAMFRGLSGPFFVFGTGILFTVVLTCIVYAVQGFEGMLGQLENAGVVEASPIDAMMFGKAFLTGGLICLIWQIFFRINKQSVTLNMAIGVYTGAVLTAVGAYEYLVGFGGAGATLMIQTTGEGIYRWMTLILLFGNFGGLLRFLLMLLFIFTGSTVVFGELFFRRSRKEKQES